MTINSFQLNFGKRWPILPMEGHYATGREGPGVEQARAVTVRILCLSTLPVLSPQQHLHTSLTSQIAGRRSL